MKKILFIVLLSIFACDTDDSEDVMAEDKLAEFKATIQGNWRSTGFCRDNNNCEDIMYQHIGLQAGVNYQYEKTISIKGDSITRINGAHNGFTHKGRFELSLVDGVVFYQEFWQSYDSDGNQYGDGGNYLQPYYIMFMNRDKLMYADGQNHDFYFRE